MKPWNLVKLIITAWQIARNEGMHILWGRVRIYLARQFSFLLPHFNSMEDVLRWLKNNDCYNIYAFDIFDTLLRRRIDPPELMKSLIADYISTTLTESGIEVSPEQVLYERNKVESILRQEALAMGKDPEFYLDDIVERTLKELNTGSVLNSKEVVDYEISLEKLATEPMPGTDAVLNYLKSLDKRVICVSGTYLSFNQMVEILEHHGLFKYVDKLYLSSELGSSKATGQLYKNILENEEDKIVHIGDDYLLDTVIPKRYGIKTLWFQSSTEQRRKNKLRKLSASHNKLNYVNTIFRANNTNLGTLYNIGYDVLGPALTVFVHCVAEQARKDGVEKIFFIARDGYVMKKIYEVLQSSIYTNKRLPEGKYMCLSRFVVRAAAINELTLGQVSEVYANKARFSGQKVSFRDVLCSYGLEPTHYIEIMKKNKLDLDKPLDNPAHDHELNGLLRDKEFQEIVRGESDQAKQLLREYLMGIECMGRHKVAMVDSNSEGITKSLLGQAFFHDKDYPMAFGYYFNLANIDSGDKSSIRLDLAKTMGMISDWRSSSPYQQKACLSFGMLIELFSHPYHGTTIGYKKINSRIIPVFKRTSQESQYQATSQGLQGILSYAKDYCRYYRLHNYKCDELLEHVRTNIIEWAVLPPEGYLKALSNLFVANEWPQESKHYIWKQTLIQRTTKKAMRLIKNIMPRLFVRVFYTS
jgi:predicted HAD superfamily hydrolase